MTNNACLFLLSFKHKSMLLGVSQVIQNPFHCCQCRLPGFAIYLDIMLNA
ncbi:hypothetical protein RchiOBHm_Chr4g0422941 [Rosa chinensis]|uniref:Uncharacterized protein n=1 Tax=Rosa chinensis TaxID=74649 RepID=A0A2P6QYG5_ROSCH|nr:hypothetical protein RchiOBHm_Chr4g0422941 [Rosa chinensis]